VNFYLASLVVNGFLVNAETAAAAEQTENAKRTRILCEFCELCEFCVTLDGT